MAKKSPVIAIGNEARDIERELRMVGRRHDLWRTWSDFCEMHALALSNACDLRQREWREARYLEIVKEYEREEIEAFARCAGLVALALNRNPHQDFLGHMFMSLELGNVNGLGQCFTPYHLCHAIALMTLDDGAIAKAERDGFITVSDPCVGGGAMLIAACQAASETWPDEWHKKVHLTGQDVDIKAVHMAYVQLSLIGAPAMIIHGNTLACETRSVWYTPGHVFGLWSHKLARRRAAEAVETVGLPAPQPASEVVALPAEKAGRRRKAAPKPQGVLF